jgi:hypothetical protein
MRLLGVVRPVGRPGVGSRSRKGGLFRHQLMRPRGYPRISWPPNKYTTPLTQPPGDLKMSSTSTTALPGVGPEAEAGAFGGEIAGPVVLDDEGSLVKH